MYLSRLILNPRSRQVQSELARPYQMHKTLLRAFPFKLPSGERVLFRLEDNPRTGLLVILVQSQYPPDWKHIQEMKSYLLLPETLPVHISENPSSKQVNLNFHPGQILAFRLNANPTVKRQGKRHGLFKVEDQLNWLERKLKTAGAFPLTIFTSQANTIHARQQREKVKNKLTLFGVRFDGTLRVMDPQTLLSGVDNGVGSGKGLGFGLLSLAPAR